MAISDPSQPVNQAIRERVLRGIALNRLPGVHFPGHFLGLSWETLDRERTVMAIADGPHCRDAGGATNLTVLAFLVDAALATIARLNAPPGSQIATVRMAMEFTGAPLNGAASVEVKPLAHSAGDALRQLTAGAVLRCGDTVAAYAGGTLAAFEPRGMLPATLPWDYVAPVPSVPADKRTLAPHERLILKACDTALTRATPQTSFIQHFWGNVPKTGDGAARQRLTVGPHLINRVGQAYGGITAGIAAANACAAAPAGMRLASAAVWFINPGQGKALRVNSRILHAGRTTSVVRTEIKTAEGTRVLEAVTQHNARQ